MGGAVEKAGVEQPPAVLGVDGLGPLPQEIVPLLLELIDVQSLVRLRRCSRLGGFQHEVHLAELRAVVLELLAVTTFPFTHAAFVLGLNGQYFSYDTVAENHYGIPRDLPPMICRLFKLVLPQAPFTTIRIQKLAAAANFGGQHRTLAFSLACPTQQELEDEQPAAQADCESHGYVLCLTRGCHGGRGEVCDDVGDGRWRLLAKPSSTARWISFPRRAWLQWHWPSRGDLYTIIVTCEPPLHRGRLTRKDRRQMAAIGFQLPCNSQCGKDSDATDSGDANGDERDAQQDPPAQVQGPRAPRRRSAAALQAARNILQLDGVPEPTVGEVEEAFRRMVRSVHPDRRGSEPTGSALAIGAVDPAGIRGLTQGWVMSQLTWARKVLREAASIPVSDVQGEAPQAQREILMLAAPELAPAAAPVPGEGVGL